MKAYRLPIIALLFVLYLLPLTSVVQAAEKPTILVWSRDVSMTLRTQHTLAWSLLEYDYQLRFLEAFPQPLTEQCQPKRLTPGELAGVDILVVSDWDGTVPCGTQDIDANLSPHEIMTVERFVAQGGKLLAVAAPVGRIEQDNLPELLTLFGISYAHTQIEPTLETPQLIQGVLQGRHYQLSLSGTVYGVGSGTSLMEYQNRSVATLAGYGKGKLAFIGSQRLLSDESEKNVGSNQLNYPPALLANENAVFFTHLISVLADRPAPSPTQSEQQLWKVRSKALKVALSDGTLINDDIPFAFEPEDAAQLERAQSAAERARDAWQRMDGLLRQPSPNYQAAELAHDQAIAAMIEAFVLVAPIKTRPVLQPQAANEMWLWGLSLLPAAAIVAYLRRHRRNIRI